MRLITKMFLVVMVLFASATSFSESSDDSGVSNRETFRSSDCGEPGGNCIDRKEQEINQ